MPIFDDFPTVAKCPKCSLQGPNNFRKEWRYSFKRSTKPAALTLHGNPVEVYACVNCGHVLKNTG